MVENSRLSLSYIIHTGTNIDQSERSNNDSDSHMTIENTYELRSGSQSLIENQSTLEVLETKSSRMRLCFQCFINFHFKNWERSDKILKLFRLLAIVGLIICVCIDTAMYLENSSNKPNSLPFICGLLYVPVEVLAIIYGSSVAAFGISIEAYILVIHAITNSVLVVQICGNVYKTIDEITWLIKMIFFFPGVELCHRNFRKLQRYNDHFNSSARSMLRQALLLGIAILGQNLQGLRAVYRGTYVTLPHRCKYTIQSCDIINLYQPLFWYDDDSCLDDLSAYVTGREQIRLLRNFILLNIASYSMFNKHFLKINEKAEYFLVRVLLIILFIALATSIPISCIDPFFFIKNCRIVYIIIESIIYIIILILMAFNLYQLRNVKENPSTGIGIMVKSPPILP